MSACQNNVDKTLNWKKIFDFDIFGEVYTINICFKSKKNKLLCSPKLKVKDIDEDKI